MGDRHKDGMTLDWALLRNWGTLPLVRTTFATTYAKAMVVKKAMVVERESYKSRRDKMNTNTTDKGQISS